MSEGLESTERSTPFEPFAGSPAPADRTARAPQRARQRPRTTIIWTSVALLVVVAAASAGLVAAARIDRPLPQPTVATGGHAVSVVPGSTPDPPWPATGQAAVAIPALGYANQSGPEQPVPIASLTKMTTALVVLRDHPVPLGSSGPTVTVTPDEAAQFDVDLANDETNIPLLPGETLTELQLLEALLVRSADDAAYTLAVWDAGSQQAFVAKMNALAASLGALHSRMWTRAASTPSRCRRRLTPCASLGPAWPSRPSPVWPECQRWTYRGPARSPTSSPRSVPTGSSG